MASSDTEMLTASSTGRFSLMPQQNRLNLPTKSVKQQAENKATWNDARSVDGADFFTIGYSGRKTEDIIKTLTGAGIRTLVDIRCNAVSLYRPDLNKPKFSRSLAEVGIEYVHLPELGVPRDIRGKAISAGTREVIWEWYDKYVVGPYVGVNLHQFFNALEHPVALMCTEADPTECHRHRLFIALEDKGLRGFDL